MPGYFIGQGRLATLSCVIRQPHRRTVFLSFALAATAATALAVAVSAHAGQLTSPAATGTANVTVGPDGRLVYTPDANGDTIPDFSMAGYGGGGVPVPSVPAAVTVPAGSGDAAGRIQAAINQVSARTPGADGFRGAVVLSAGVFELHATLNITASGVVLRGAGDGTGGTTLKLAGFGGPAIQVRGSGTSREVPGTRHSMADSYVPVGAESLRLDSTAGLRVGDAVQVVRPATANWLADIGQPTWRPSDFSIGWNRTITAIQGDRVSIDAPVMQAMEAKYGGGYLYKRSVSNQLTHVGIEGLRAESSFGVDALGNTGGSFISISRLTDGWVDHVTEANMRGHAVKVSSSQSLTIQNATAFEHPLPGGHHGASTQIFTMDHSQLLLWRDIVASDGGFEFSSGPVNPGPNVWLDDRVPHGFAATSPHMKWSVGTLYDRMDLNQTLSIQDNFGSHGWTAANSVVWNVNANAGINCDRPPTAHQWLFGVASVSPVKGPRKGGLPCENTSFGHRMLPDSLYLAQLKDRLG